MVALTGVEPANRQFSSVQFSLSGCRFSTVGIPGWSGIPPRSADVTAQSQRSRGQRGAGEAAALRKLPIELPNAPPTGALNCAPEASINAANHSSTAGANAGTFRKDGFTAPIPLASHACL